MPSIAWMIVLCLQISFSYTFSQFRWISGISVALIIIIAKGYVVEYQHTHLFRSGENIIINGEVDSFFKENTFGYSGVLEVYQVNDYRFPYFFRPKVRLYTSKHVNLGDIIQVKVLLRPIIGLKNEVGFDAEKYYFSQHILAKAFTKGPLTIRAFPSSFMFRERLYSLFKKRTEKFKNRSLAYAISFADRSLLTYSEWDYLRTSGLAHLVAISGLHIGIAYFIGYFLGLVIIRIGRVSEWIPLSSGLLVAFFYSWLAGFSLSTTRALIMISLHVFFSLCRYQVSIPYRLLITLAIVFCIDPFAAFSSSFWLSFLAVGAVFLQGQLLIDVPSRWRKLIIANMLMSFMMMPISAYFFGGVSLFAAGYNFICIPLFSIIIIPCLFWLLVDTLLPFDGPDIIWNMWDQLLGIVPFISQYSLDYWFPTSSIVIITFIALIFILFIRSLLRRKTVILLILTCCILPQMQQSREDEKRWSVDILDVGQGLAVLIQKNGHSILYDTGKSWVNGSMANSVISPLLHYRGMRHIDGLILSHLDNDHAGGEKDIIKHWHPQWILSSRLSTTDLPCQTGKTWIWEMLTFKVLWPKKLVTTPGNAHSCVIRISDDVGHSILLTGDLDKYSEWKMLRMGSKVAADILLVPHHGSNTSSSIDFVHRVNADVAIASLSKGNRWHFPKQKVVERYLKNGTRWLDTGSEGQIHITFFSNDYQIHTLRHVNNTPWYRQMLRKKVE